MEVYIRALYSWDPCIKNEMLPFMDTSIYSIRITIRRHYLNCYLKSHQSSANLIREMVLKQNPTLLNVISMSVVHYAMYLIAN